MKKNSWNKMASWYDGMVGTSGHKYHQEYAIPTVMKLLNLKKGQTVLDVGCGQGALASYIKKQECGYFGVDSSDEMIMNARKRHSKEGKFFVGSADALTQNRDINFIKFDAVVFMLSIQDMEPLNKIIKEAAKLLTYDGKIVIFMLHPSFRIPRQSGWGEDKNRKIIYRRVDRYLTEETIPLDTNVKQKGKSVTSFFHHRPLQEYFKELGKNGFAVDHLLEISEDKIDYGEFPTFLALRAQRQK